MNNPDFTRRNFIQKLALSLAALGIKPITTFAQPVIPVRREVHSTEAEPVVDQYRRAVTMMQQFPAWDPRSWWFQANIHGLPRFDDPFGCVTDACLDQIFTPPADATDQEEAHILSLEQLVRGEMARAPDAGLSRDRVWSKCPHGKLDFLPWHRLYLWYFERIVSEVLEEPFALPYWNYLDQDKRNLPPMFRSETLADGTINPLFSANRNPQALEVTPDPNDPLIRDIDLQWSRAEEQDYFQRGDLFESDDGTFEFGVGFSSQIESLPHNQIHVRIGNRQGMGNPSFAARDPVFYVHHAQIDRLWEAWRIQEPEVRDLLGGENEDAFSSEPYVFALADGRPDGHSAHVFPLFVDNVYTYDTLEVSSAGPGPAAPTPPLPVPIRQSLSREPTSVRDAPVRIPLSPAPTRVGPATAQPRNLANRRFILRVEAELSSGAGGASIDIYLDAPGQDGTEPAGSFSVFMDPDKSMPKPSLSVSEAGGMPDTHTKSVTLETDVSVGVRNLLESGASLAELGVRLEPSTPLPEGAFSVTTVDLFEK